MVSGSSVPTRTSGMVPEDRKLSSPGIITCFGSSGRRGTQLHRDGLNALMHACMCVCVW